MTCESSVRDGNRNYLYNFDESSKRKKRKSEQKTTDPNNYVETTIIYSRSIPAPAIVSMDGRKKSSRAVI